MDFKDIKTLPSTVTNSDGDQPLQEFYTTYGAVTIEQKIANLERELGRANMYGTNQVGPVSLELRLSLYEHEWKVAHGFITPIYA